MELHGTVAGFRKALEAERSAGRRVGVVLTMGALHDGHASLLRRAGAECDVVAATLFVNPLQFGPGEDLDTYPRPAGDDRRRAEQEGVDHLFAPPVEEMFPVPPRTAVRVAGAESGPEGAARPGHLDGVATVVTKLLSVVGPARAYFGEKDWEQLEVVRALVSDLSLPVEVVACPTVRHEDGLALSSRNRRLSPAERRAATVLHRALLAGRRSPDPAGAVRRVVASEPLVELDYAATLGRRLLVAARVGGTRLIDNLALEES